MPTTTPTLHYIHDPLCGWCYGAAPLVKVARETLPVVAHAGGMMAGAQRRPVTPELRAFVVSHDRRIAQATGQPFGSAYSDGLMCDARAVLDSAPPITAVLAADSLGQRGLDMLARLQKAHYVEGQRIADVPVLQTLAAGLGLDAAAFAEAYRRFEGAPTLAHIADSRALLNRVGGQGFPTFVLATEGRWQRVDIGPYLGQPEAWRAWLLAQEGVQAAQPGASGPLCGLDGCTP